MTKSYGLFCLIATLLLLSMYTNAQDQSMADSLKALLENDQYDQTNYLSILEKLSGAESDPNNKLVYSDRLIKEAVAVDSVNRIIAGYMEKGNALRLKGEYSDAVESYFSSLDQIKSDPRYDYMYGSMLISIADVYSAMGNSGNAFKYYFQGLEQLRITNDSTNLASALSNIGDEYILNGNLDSALLFSSEAELIFDRIGHRLGQAFSQGNIGMIYAEQGNVLLAEQKMNAAIETMEELGEHYAISVYLTYISDIYAQKNDNQEAIKYASRSLEIAEKLDLKEQISDAHLLISQLQENVGNSDLALIHYKDYVRYRDSIINIRSVEEIADIRTEFEVAQKQSEVDLLSEKRRGQRIANISLSTIAGLFLILLLTLYWYYRSIAKEKKRSESLLLNILPEETAEELKTHGKVEAKRLESVTVLFTDFVGFSSLSSQIPARKLVKSIDHYFSRFDEIIERHGLEKIKTIGDAYMCAGGLPEPIGNHEKKVISAGLEMITFVNEMKQAGENGVLPFEIRVGVHTGPVVAGVVGTKKFQYDIWGESVNIAARMESNSEPGKINISEETYLVVKEEFDCTFRGEIQAKNVGLLKMYFVNGKMA